MSRSSSPSSPKDVEKAIVTTTTATAPSHSQDDDIESAITSDKEVMAGGVTFEDPSSPVDRPFPQLAFADDDAISRAGRIRTRGSLSRKRSASRDSISSVRSRTQGQSTIPIEFRTLSFRVADSQAISEKGGATSRKDHLKGSTPSEDLEQTDKHTVNIEELYRRHRTSPKQGLSKDAAATRLQQDGKNILPARRQQYWKKLLGYIFGGFCSILWIGVIIFFICWRPLGDPDPAPYNLGLAILIIIVIFLQASFSAFQDWSTAKTMNSILDMLPADAMAFRDGEYVKVPASDLVVGDIVRIRIGDKVPADLRIISTSDDIRFDRSMLTGESEEVDGSIEVTDNNFLETRNIAFGGTLVTNGTATGLVVLTGAKSVMGRIAMTTSNVKDKPTLIQREITRFVIIICCLTACLAALILFTWVGWLRVDHYSYMNVVAMLNNVMGCVVAFIPEGMPVGVALTLMMIARRMKSVNVLPKSLATVEMLGCVNVICSDKTGTLTENKMTVTSVGFLDNLLSAKDAREELADEKQEGREALNELVRASHLCLDASFEPTTLHLPVEQRLTQGNPTEGAVLRFAESAKSGTIVKESYPLKFQIPFNSKNKWMLTLHEDKEGCAEDEYIIVIKGAPDVLLPKCTSYWSYKQNKALNLDSEALELFSGLQTQLSKRAERVLLFTQRRYKPVASLGSNNLSQEITEQAMSELVIIGMLGVFDPPRAESASTVAACRRAGIRFFMMTGDFGLTGAAIARQIGVFTGEREPDTFQTIVDRRASSSESDDRSDSKTSVKSGTEYSSHSLLLEGVQISNLEDADWDTVCAYEEIVFGRCSPEHKLRIINELHKRGNATAVTGDGVNDAPALKAADVGIAIVTGSDVALEAADLVLLDKFDSIVEGIRLGRLVFQNLQKVIGYLLPAGSWSEIWPVLLNVFFGVPLPLSSFLMIIICVFTDLGLSLSLIMEKEEFDLLSLPPRNHKKDHLINLKIYAQSYLFIGVMETICAHSMYFLYYWKHAHIPVRSLWFAFESYSAGFYGYTETELLQFNRVGQSVYFVTLVLLQWGNILSVRSKRQSILQADPIRRKRRNPWIALSMVISLVIAIFVTEEPGLQRLFGTASIPLEFWFLPLPLALGILLMDELRKLIVRTWPKGPIARIAW